MDRISKEQKVIADRRGVEVEVEPIEIDFMPYDASQTIKRQMFWLSWVSKKLAQERNGLKLLDIGSNLFWLSGISSQFNVEMVDVRPHPLMDHFPFKMHIGDAVSLPFEEETFDLVTFPQLLHWIGTAAYGGQLKIDADFDALAEIARILKSGGAAYFVTFVVPGTGVFKIGGRRLYGVGDLQMVLDRAGLKIDELTFYSPNFQEISENQLTLPTGKELVRGNPDEDICWAFLRVTK